MNPSPEPGSPISGSSTSDSETESQFTQPLASRGPRDAASHWSNLLGGGGSGGGGGGGPYRTGLIDNFTPQGGKRRNPPSHVGVGSRDVKSRRREEGPSSGARRGPQVHQQQHQAAPSGSAWSGEGGSKKEDLVDQHIVDQLRAQFGDPFFDGEAKNSTV